VVDKAVASADSQVGRNFAKLPDMIQLNADESRVLGVLIEKAMTTPEQYPLSLNAVVNGANQKSNRDPVVSMSEDQAYQALEGLRAKGLVVRVDIPGNRVPKFKHGAGDVLHARPGEVAILAELLLRGPQTLGELRGRAGRMSPMESLESTRELLRALMERQEPLVKEVPAAPGTRADKFTQLLCPDPRAIQSELPGEPKAASAGLAERVQRIEAELAELKSQVRQLSEAAGQPISSD
jgi:uncharacterized protein YceH (UPF0502 family)